MSTSAIFDAVRRRRRELAVFKTIGFTRRQLAATVAWQSSVWVVLGLVAGVPLGINYRAVAVNIFATQINAVPWCSPTWWRRSRGASRPAPQLRSCCGLTERRGGYSSETRSSSDSSGTRSWSDRSKVSSVSK
jgi:hypothetical protein